MKKFFFVGAALVALCGAVNAAKPKTETKSEIAASTEVKTKAKDASTTYYVIAQSETSYTLSQDPEDEGNCDGGSFPCQITSDNASLGTSVSKADVASHTDNIQVTETRSSL